MRVRKFIRTDLQEINMWFVQRNMKTLEYEELPKNGFVIPGVCAVFLYVTDSTLGFLEGLVVNKDISPGIRREALTSVIDAAIQEAKILRLKKLLFMTDQRSVERYGAQFGFEFQKLYNLYQKEI